MMPKPFPLHSLISFLLIFISAMPYAVAETLPGYQADLPPLKRADHRTGSEPAGFVRFMQCQLDITTTRLPAADGILDIADPAKTESLVRKCLSLAAEERAQVVVLPEYSVDLPERDREKLFDDIRGFTQQTGSMVIAGSFIDASRYNRIAVFGNGWEELGYKMNPSKYEVSYYTDKGVTPGEHLLLLDTDYGRFLILTCVDLISDKAQFVARHLATLDQVDVILNINHNPAALEFLIEANSIVRRHPVFVSITNATVTPGRSCMNDGQLFDTGRCSGRSAVFSTLYESDTQLPTDPAGLNYLPSDALQLDAKGKPYAKRVALSNLIADAGAFFQGALVYELNMRLKRIPKSANAPDQGYPAIRGLKLIPFENNN